MRAPLSLDCPLIINLFFFQQYTTTFPLTYNSVFQNMMNSILIESFGIIFLRDLLKGFLTFRF